MVEILNWSHNTWNGFFCTAVLRPCQNVRGLLLQCHMDSTENSDLFSASSEKKLKNFPPWDLPALQNIHWRKFKGKLEQRSLASCSAQGLRWGSGKRNKREKKKKKKEERKGQRAGKERGKERGKEKREKRKRKREKRKKKHSFQGIFILGRCWIPRTAYLSSF